MSDQGLPKDHIAHFPAGYKRDEENKKRTDDLAQKAEEEAAETGQTAIDPTKFHRVDNEIGGPWEEQTKRAREFGLKALHMTAEEMNSHVGVTNPVPGWRYVWASVHEDTLNNSDAKSTVYLNKEKLKAAGWFPVTDWHDADTAREFRSGEAGLRRWGDVILWCIWIEQFRKLERDFLDKLRRMGMIEEKYAYIGQRRMESMGGIGTAYNQHDPRMAQAYGAEKMRPFTQEIRFERKEG